MQANFNIIQLSMDCSRLAWMSERIWKHVRALGGAHLEVVQLSPSAHQRFSSSSIYYTKYYFYFSFIFIFILALFQLYLFLFQLYFYKKIFTSLIIIIIANNNKLLTTVLLFIGKRYLQHLVSFHNQVVSWYVDIGSSRLLEKDSASVSMIMWNFHHLTGQYSILCTSDSFTHLLDH